MLTLMSKHLMGAQEIEQLLGVSRQRVYVLTRRADWPEPYDTLAMGKVWRIKDVEAWVRENRPDLELSDAEDPQSGPASDVAHRPKPMSLQAVVAELEQLRARVESLEVARESLGESP